MLQIRILVKQHMVKEWCNLHIKTILTQHRRDFTAIYECEHCGFTMKSDGYDDTNFHVNVIPNMKCTACGKIADENYRPLKTKYPDGFQI